MNSNEMETIWNSRLNTLAPEQQKQLAGQFARQMLRRRRFQNIWLINIFAWLAIITALALRTILSNRVNLEQEWASLPLLVMLWAFATYFLRSYLKSKDSLSRGELSVVESLRAALASNLNRQSRLKIVGVLYIVFVPILALAVRQLQTVGKVWGDQLISMIVLFGGALLISALAMTGIYFRRLLPEQKRLEGLLADAVD